MAKKTASSYLPNGGYSLEHGSNYMLDGFQFDTEYGAGPYEKARLPEAKGLSSLPSGMIPMGGNGESSLPDGVEVDMPLDLEDFTKDASQSIALVDHSWLATQSKPDLSGQRSMEDILEHLSQGRFENPEVNQFKNLQEAWGTESTTGLDIIPNNQRHHEKYKNTYKEVSNLPGDDIRHQAEKLHRKLAYGESLSSVLKDASNPLALKLKIEDEYGLHGRVYIKEAHFPGLFNGRWDEVIHNRCKTAMYIIPVNKDCAFDRFLGMEIVASVNDIPWSKVARTLMPRLESYGVKTASSLSHKEQVRTAFIDLIEGRVTRHEANQTWFPTQRNESDFISLDHARRQLEASQQEHIFIATHEDRHETKTEKKLARIASQLAKQGFLDEEVITAVTETTSKTAQEKIDRLFHLATTPTQASTYDGTGIGVKTHTPTKSKLDKLPDMKKRASALLWKDAHDKVDKLLKFGLITKEVYSSIQSITEAGAYVKKAFELASKPLKASTYEGSGKEASLHTTTKSKIATEFKTRTELTFEQRVKTASEKLKGLASTGLLSSQDIERIATIHRSNPEDAVKVAFKRAADNFTEDQASTYVGIGKNAHTLDTRVALLNDSDLLGLKEASKKKDSDLLGLKEAASRTERGREQRSLEKVGLLIKAGLITHDEVAVAIKGSKTPEDRVRRVFDFVARPKVASQYHEYDLKEHRMVKRTKKIATEFKTRTELTFEQREESVRLKMSKLLDSGLVSADDVRRVVASHVGEPELQLKALFRVASEKVERAFYEGSETAHIITPKKSERLSDSEMKVATWLRQKMSEGGAGQELDVLLSSRFSQKVLDTYTTRIASLRTEHEGLSGHAYVDAGAYVTEGVEGCDKGALLHRSNQIPTLLGVGKCSTCVFNVEGTCQKYNKVLIDSPSEITDSLSALQQENIRLANGTDADRTASLFVNDYDPDEFGLLPSDHVEIGEEVSNKSLGDVLFGGFEV